MRFSFGGHQGPKTELNPILSDQNQMRMCIRLASDKGQIRVECDPVFEVLVVGWHIDGLCKAEIHASVFTLVLGQ